MPQHSETAVPTPVPNAAASEVANTQVERIPRAHKHKRTAQKSSFRINNAGLMLATAAIAAIISFYFFKSGGKPRVTLWRVMADEIINIVIDNLHEKDSASSTYIDDDTIVNTKILTEGETEPSEELIRAAKEWIMLASTREKLEQATKKIAEGKHARTLTHTITLPGTDKKAEFVIEVVKSHSPRDPLEREAENVFKNAYRTLAHGTDTETLTVVGDVEVRTKLSAKNREGHDVSWASKEIRQKAASLCRQIERPANLVEAIKNVLEQKTSAEPIDTFIESTETGESGTFSIYLTYNPPTDTAEESEEAAELSKSKLIKAQRRFFCRRLLSEDFADKAFLGKSHHYTTADGVAGVMKIEALGANKQPSILLTTAAAKWLISTEGSNVLLNMYNSAKDAQPQPPFAVKIVDPTNGDSGLMTIIVSDETPADPFLESEEDDTNQNPTKNASRVLAEEFGAKAFAGHAHHEVVAGSVVARMIIDSAVTGETPSFLLTSAAGSWLRSEAGKETLMQLYEAASQHQPNPPVNVPLGDEAQNISGMLTLSLTEYMGEPGIKEIDVNPAPPLPSFIARHILAEQLASKAFAGYTEHHVVANGVMADFIVKSNDNSKQPNILLTTAAGNWLKSEEAMSLLSALYKRTTEGQIQPSYSTSLADATNTESGILTLTVSADPYAIQDPNMELPETSPSFVVNRLFVDQLASMAFTGKADPDVAHGIIIGSLRVESEDSKKKPSLLLTTEAGKWLKTEQGVHAAQTLYDVAVQERPTPVIRQEIIDPINGEKGNLIFSIYHAKTVSEENMLDAERMPPLEVTPRVLTDDLASKAFIGQTRHRVTSDGIIAGMKIQAEDAMQTPSVLLTTAAGQWLQSTEGRSIMMSLYETATTNVSPAPFTVNIVDPIKGETGTLTLTISAVQAAGESLDIVAADHVGTPEFTARNLLADELASRAFTGYSEHFVKADGVLAHMRIKTEDPDQQPSIILTTAAGRWLKSEDATQKLAELYQAAKAQKPLSPVTVEVFDAVNNVKGFVTITVIDDLHKRVLKHEPRQLMEDSVVSAMALDELPTNHLDGVVAQLLNANDVATKLATSVSHGRTSDEVTLEHSTGEYKVSMEIIPERKEDGYPSTCMLQLVRRRMAKEEFVDMVAESLEELNRTGYTQDLAIPLEVALLEERATVYLKFSQEREEPEDMID